MSPDQLLRLPYVSVADSAQREYFVYLPKGYGDDARKWPVMLFLHGNGERGNGLDELDYVMKHGPLYEAWVQQRDLPFLIIAPQLHMFGMDSVAAYIRNRTRAEIPVRLMDSIPPRPQRFPTPYPMTGSSQDTLLSHGPEGLPVGWPLVEKDLLGMIDHVLENYQADAQRVYLTGLSYGGFGSWYMASTYPERFAAVAPVVGWGHPELMAPIAKHQIPVWAFAGGRDLVVPVKYFYSGINELEKLGLTELRFTVHEDLGHDAWVRVYGGEDLYSWMLQFRKK